MFNINCTLPSHRSWHRYPLFNVYRCMIMRCTLPSHRSWHRYGGRGIKVCDEWQKSYQVFAQWATDNGFELGLQLDRIDNDGNYEPSNCRFVTSLENNQNKTKGVCTHKGKHFKKSVICIETGEEYASATEASRALGLNPSAVSHRISRGQKCFGLTFKYK